MGEFLHPFVKDNFLKKGHIAIGLTVGVLYLLANASELRTGNSGRVSTSIPIESGSNKQYIIVPDCRVLETNSGIGLLTSQRLQQVCQSDSLKKRFTDHDPSFVRRLGY